MNGSKTSPESYWWTIDQEVARQFSPDATKKKQNGKYLLDTVKSNIVELKEAGISEIEYIDICTYENVDKFFSARKEDETGRFLAYIALP